MHAGKRVLEGGFINLDLPTSPAASSRTLEPRSTPASTGWRQGGVQRGVPEATSTWRRILSGGAGASRGVLRFRVGLSHVGEVPLGGGRRAASDLLAP